MMETGTARRRAWIVEKTGGSHGMPILLGVFSDPLTAKAAAAVDARSWGLRFRSEIHGVETARTRAWTYDVAPATIFGRSPRHR